MQCFIYVRVQNDVQTAFNNDVHYILSTPEERTLSGYFYGGLNKLQTIDAAGDAIFKSYECGRGIAARIYCSPIREDKGNLWMSTENGISKFIPEEERFENYADGHVCVLSRFSEAASAYTSWGDLLFGPSNNGVLLFNPDSIGKETYVPPLVFPNCL